MKDILRPILELLVVLPGLLLGYFPVKTYLKQSPGRLAAWLFPLMACLCIGSGLACYRLGASTFLALAGVTLAACIPERLPSPSGNPARLRCPSARCSRA